MENSVILNTITKIYERLCLYYSHSGLSRLFKGLSEVLGKLSQGSGIIQFFAKRWKTDIAWKNSYTLAMLLLPLRLIRLVTVRLAVPIKHDSKSSLLVKGVSAFFGGMFGLSTRIYGLFLLAFTATEGVLWVILKPIEVEYLILRILLLLLAFILILVNRSLKALYSGSAVARLVTNFFLVRGIENGTDYK